MHQPGNDAAGLMQSVSSEVLVKGQPPLVITGTQVYSHWSDSALTIPTVPAS